MNHEPLVNAAQAGKILGLKTPTSVHNIAKNDPSFPKVHSRKSTETNRRNPNPANYWLKAEIEEFAKNRVKNRPVSRKKTEKRPITFADMLMLHRVMAGKINRPTPAIAPPKTVTVHVESDWMF